MNLPVLLTLLMAIAAGGYLLLAFRLLRKERSAGSLPLGLVFVMLAIWVAGGALQTGLSSLLFFSAGHVAHYVATALTPILILICFRELTGSATSVRTTTALLIIPVLSIVVASTNPWHELMWLPPFQNADGEGLVRPSEFGQWFRYVHLPYGYTVIGAALFALLMHSPAISRTQRRGLATLAISVIIPVAGVAAYNAGYGPATLPLVPMLLTLMLPVYAWLSSSDSVVEFTPFAYETVFQNMQDPCIVVDHQQRVIGLNRGAEAMLEKNERDAFREPIDDVFGMEAQEVRAAIRTGLPQKMLTRSGRYLHVQATPLSANAETVKTASVLMFRDVSDVERAQREVQNSERLLRTLIDHSVNGIIRLRWKDGELRCIFANSAAGKYLGSSPEQMIGESAASLLAMATNGLDASDVDLLQRQFERAVNNGAMVDTETRVGGSQEGKWLRMICEPVGEDFAMTFVDVSDGKAREIQMESIARSDPLTGLLNRRGFERDAARRLSASPDDASGALMFIDLNEFKQINDRFGHDAGDELLKIAARRLQKSLRPGDLIGRPGGDEFVALIPDVKADVAESLAARLTRSLEQTYPVEGRDLRCSASIGLALYPLHANTLTGLLREADAAMYRAKERGRGVTRITDSNASNDVRQKKVS